MTLPISLARLEQLSAQIAAGDASLGVIAHAIGIPQATLWDRMRKFNLPTRYVGLLTPRQAQVIEMRSNGVRNREIATRLGIEEATVRSLLRHLNLKINQAMSGERVLSADEVERPDELRPVYIRTPWTDEKDAALHALIAAGLSISAAGRAMGIGKNAAIARMKRTR